VGSPPPFGAQAGAGTGCLSRDHFKDADGQVKPERGEAMFITGVVIGAMLGATAGFMVCALLTLSRHIDEEDGRHVREG
jgi:hypothetical protein